MDYNEVLQRARARMAPRCKVCPECNGLGCGNMMPGPGSKAHGIKQQQLEHAVVVEIIEPAAHEARLHAGAVAVMHAHKTAPRRSPYWPRR